MAQIGHFGSSSTDVTVSAGVITLTCSLPAPTISTVQNVTVSAGVLTLTSSLPAPTVTTVQNTTVSAGVVTGTLSLPDPTITAIKNVSVTADVLSMTGSLPAPTVTTIQSVTVSSGVVTGTLSLPSPTITTVQHVTVSADVLSLSASLPSPTITTVADQGRLWSSGFELNSATAGMEWTLGAGGNFGTIVTTPVRSGTYAGRVSSLSSGSKKGFGYIFSSSEGNGPYYSRFYFRVATLPSAENTICDFENGFLTKQAKITLDNTGVLRLYDEDGVIGSPSTALSTNTWYRIELKIDRTPSAGSQIVEARLDGTSFASGSSSNLSSGISRFLIGGNLAAETQTAGDWFFDDIAINTNDWAGAGSIVHLRPNASGDNTGWTSGTGSTFAEVDEVTPDDTTTYLSTSTFNTVADFNVDDTPAAIQSGDTISLVQAGIRFRASGAPGNNLLVDLRIKSNTGGTVSSSNIDFTTATISTNAVATPRNYPLTLYKDPDNISWSKSLLDTTQIGVKLTDPSDVSPIVSTLWLLVEYTPSVATDVSVSADLLSGTLSLPSPTVSTVQNATVSSGVIAGTLSLPSPTVTTVQNTTVSAGVLTMTASLPAPTQSSNQIVSAGVLTMTGSLPNPTISTVRNVTVYPPCLNFGKKSNRIILVDGNMALKVAGFYHIGI